MRSRTAAIAFIGCMILTTDAAAATFTRVVHSSQTMIFLSGDIVQGDAERLRDLIARADEGRPITTIVLDSPGGNLVTSLALASLVHGQNLNTIIGPKATCASACFLVFAAGNVKYADYACYVGVHGVADKGGLETADSRAATVAFARIVQHLGAPPSIISKLLTTPPHNIVRLTAADLQGMGVVMTGRRARPPRVAPTSAHPMAPAAIY
jgi:hypothetical protein